MIKLKPNLANSRFISRQLFLENKKKQQKKLEGNELQLKLWFNFAQNVVFHSSKQVCSKNIFSLDIRNRTAEQLRIQW